MKPILIFIFICCSYSTAIYQSNYIGIKNKKSLTNLATRGLLKSTERDEDDIFGNEFRNSIVTTGISSKVETEFVPYDWKKELSKKDTKTISPEKRQKILRGYDNMRASFIIDSIFVSLVGFCAIWYLGTFKDAYSYGVGALLGASYAILLGKYVENLGKEQRSVGGNLRFAPVILLVLLYSKNKETISIIPEIFGFFSYQLGSFLQAFNEDAYLNVNDNDENAL
jgi:hypothetical protein